MDEQFAVLGDVEWFEDESGILQALDWKAEVEVSVGHISLCR